MFYRKAPLPRQAPSLHNVLAEWRRGRNRATWPLRRISWFEGSPLMRVTPLKARGEWSRGAGERGESGDTGIMAMCLRNVTRHNVNFVTEVVDEGRRLKLWERGWKLWFYWLTLAQLATYIPVSIFLLMVCLFPSVNIIKLLEILIPFVLRFWRRLKGWIQGWSPYIFGAGIKVRININVKHSQLILF